MAETAVCSCNFERFQLPRHANSCPAFIAREAAKPKVRVLIEEPPADPFAVQCIPHRYPDKDWCPGCTLAGEHIWEATHGQA